jgi:predicted acylesterase/phospholipase RssA
VGAWEALEEGGVLFKGIVGTSIGALIGACIAGGMAFRELVRLARTLKRRSPPRTVGAVV